MLDLSSNEIRTCTTNGLFTLLFVGGHIPIQGILLGIILISIVYLIFRVEFGRINFIKPSAVTITIRFSKEELSPEHQKVLQTALNITDKSNLPEALAKIGKAALLEYSAMIIESGIPSKIDDVRIDRLFGLIQHYFKNKLPDENEVDKIFHTGNKSRALLQNTISKHKNKITIIFPTLFGYLSSAKFNNESQYHEFECTPALITEMNNIIREEWSSLEIISRVYKTANLYKCAQDTFKNLTEYLKK
jgi:hypothetical protein